MLRRFISNLGILEKLNSITMLLILMGILVMALSPELFEPLNPFSQDLEKAFKKPDGLNILGCDQLGRDLYSRIIHGASYSLWIGVSVATITILIPIILSSLVLFSKPIWNQFYLLLLDIFLVFPPLLLAILIAASNDEPSTFQVVVALSLGGWAANGRLVRSYLMQVQEQEFILAAKSVGASDFRIYFFHLLPNILNQLTVLWSFRCGQMILAEATLSFLGLGGGPDNLSWGWLVLEGKAHLTSAWLLSLAPATLIALVVYSFQTLGEVLEKLLLPRPSSKLLEG